MKRIILFVFSLIALVNASQAVTVSDVAGVFTGTLTGSNKKEVYILPGVEENTITLVLPSYTYNSTDLGTIVLTNIPMDASGTLTQGSRSLYIPTLTELATVAVEANSVLAASSANVSLSIQASKLGESPIAVQFSGSRVAGKNYDIENGGFEGSWSSNEPNGWNSFVSADGSLASFVSGNTGQFTQSSDKRPGSAGSYSACIQSKITLGAKGNGNCTNGRINAGSTSASDASGNYNFSDPSSNDKYKTAFVGLPDSLVFWAKYIPGGGDLTAESNQARMNAVITKNARYQDPENNSATFAAAKIGQAYINYKATSNKGWQRLAAPFNYTSADPSEAAYILITFSTNYQPGGGNSTKKSPDNVYLDDAEMVYNHSLTSLKLDNTDVEFTNGQASTDLEFSQSEYNLATTTNSKHAKTFVGYEAATNKVHVYVVGNNYPTTNASYSAYTLQMKQPIINNEYAYTAYSCANEPYSDEYFTNLTEAGTHTLTKTNWTGGNDVITLTLEHWEVDTTVTNMEMLLGQQKTWEQQDLSKLAVGQHTLYANYKNIHGCDSVCVLNITITAPTTYGQYTAATCANEPYTDNLFTEALTKPGEYTTTITNCYGGDSINTLTLTHWQLDTIHTDKTMMFGRPETWEGKNLDTLSIGKHTLYAHYTNQHGCDSLRVLHLTVTAIPNTSYSYQASTCANQPYTDELFTEALTKSGSYKKTIRNCYGGDSVVTLTLTVWPVDTIQENMSMMQGTQLTWEGQDLDTLSVGKHTLYANLTSSHGCDSVRVLNIIVTLIPTTYNDYEATTCANEPYSDDVFTNLKKSGVYRDTIENVLGGDSVVTLTLTVWPVAQFDIYKTMIVGDPEVWEGQDLSTKPVGKAKIKKVLTSSHGCDSIRVLHLTVIPVPDTEYAYEAGTCEGTPYSDDLFTDLTTAGEYTTMIRNSRGADSTVTLTLTIWPLTKVEQELTITVGEPAEWEGHDLSVLPVGEQTLSETYPDEHGCDSTMVLHLNVQEKVATSITTTKQPAGNIRKVFYNGQLYIIREDETKYSILGTKIQ